HWEWRGWTVSVAWITSALPYGCDQTLLFHFRRADDYRRDHRLCESRQPRVDHRRLDYGCSVARGRIHFARTSRGGTCDGVHCFTFAGRAIRSEVYSHRQSDAGRVDVDLERDRNHRRAGRLAEKVIAWQDRVCAYCERWSFSWRPRFSQ